MVKKTDNNRNNSIMKKSSGRKNYFDEGNMMK